MEAAKAVHNALLATMCFGYMPPMRHNSVLLTLTAPHHTAGCLHPDCQHRGGGGGGCQGNRVHKHPATGSWWLRAPHHKGTKAWGGAAIKVQLPTEVAELLQHHLDWGMQTIAGLLQQTAAGPDPPLQPTLFFNTSTGQPLKPQEVSQLWSRTVLGGSGVHFGPQLCRSIFVVGTRDTLGAAAAAAGTEAGMAMAMGNSQAVWDSVYDRHFNSRQADQAMAAMPGWRHAMLASINKP